MTNTATISEIRYIICPIPEDGERMEADDARDFAESLGWNAWEDDPEIRHLEPSEISQWFNCNSARVMVREESDFVDKGWNIPCLVVNWSDIS